MAKIVEKHFVSAIGCVLYYVYNIYMVHTYVHICNKIGTYDVTPFYSKRVPPFLEV